MFDLNFKKSVLTKAPPFCSFMPPSTFAFWQQQKRSYVSKAIHIMRGLDIIIAEY